MAKVKLTEEETLKLRSYSDIIHKQDRYLAIAGAGAICKLGDIVSTAYLAKGLMGVYSITIFANDCWLWERYWNNERKPKLIIERWMQMPSPAKLEAIAINCAKVLNNNGIWIEEDIKRWD